MARLPEKLTDNTYPAYAWPGGYPLMYVTADGGVLCPRCVSANDKLLHDPYDKQWYVIGYQVNWEDTTIHCDHCNVHIESAYGGDEESA